MKKTMTLSALLLGLGSGCDDLKAPTPPATALFQPTNTTSRMVYADFPYGISVVDVEGTEYVVVATPHGVAICPKVFPTSKPETE